MNEQLDCRLSPEVLLIDVPAQGNLSRSHNESFETLSEDVRVIQTCETVGFVRKDLSWTMFRDNPWPGRWMWRRCWSMLRIHTASTWWKFCSDRMDPRTHEDRPSTWSQSHVSFGTVRTWSSSEILENLRIPLVDCHFQRDEKSKLEKFSKKKGESVYHEGMATSSGTGKPVATKHKGQPSPRSNPVSKMFAPIDQRKWHDIPAVDYVSKRSLSWRVSKIMTKMVRHHGSHREDDGAIDWNTLTFVMPRHRIRECRGMDK